MGYSPWGCKQSDMTETDTQTEDYNLLEERGYALLFLSLSLVLFIVEYTTLKNTYNNYNRNGEILSIWRKFKIFW